MQSLVIFLVLFTVVSCTTENKNNAEPIKDKPSIRYDSTPSAPGGYFAYCEKNPQMPECGSKSK